MNNEEILNRFKLSGYRTRITHLRNIDDELYDMKTIRENNGQNLINSHGGKTLCEVMLNNYVALSAVAICNPKDKYNRKDGANLALSRAYDYAFGGK